MLPFEKLEVYNKAVDYIDCIYDLIESFPKEERFGLIDQLRRASVSISTNIAEGSGRYHKKDFTQFLRMARSSAYECVALLQVSLKRKYITEESYNDLYGRVAELTKMISGLVRSLGE